MVSGLVTSPCDQLRIFSGDARLMRMESKSAIKLALSYGEDRKITSRILLRKRQNFHREAQRRKFVWLLCASAVRKLSPLPAPCRSSLHAASSSTPRPDTTTAIRESA